MKAIISTAILFFVAGICVAGVPQPTQHHTTNFVDILTYSNVMNQKSRCNSGPKVYALSLENTPCSVPSAAQPSSNNNSGSPLSQTFTPSPLVNYYKEFR